jgi:hypothetical protein
MRSHPLLNNFYSYTRCVSHNFNLFRMKYERRFFFLCVYWKIRDSVVGIETRYGLDGPGIESRWGRDFPHRSKPTLGPTQPCVQWVPNSSRLGGGGGEPPGSGVDHPPPSSAEVKERVELYLCSPSGPSWSVIRRPLTLRWKIHASAADSAVFNNMMYVVVTCVPLEVHSFFVNVRQQVIFWIWYETFMEAKLSRARLVQFSQFWRGMRDTIAVFSDRLPCI